MRSFRKSIICLLLVLVLSVSMLPVTASANVADPAILGSWETYLTFPSSILGQDTNDIVYRLRLDFSGDGAVRTSYQAVDLTALRLYYHEFFCTAYYATAYGAGYTSLEEIEDYCMQTTGLCVADYIFMFMSNYDMNAIFTPQPAKGAFHMGSRDSIRLDLLLFGQYSDHAISNYVSIDGDTMILHTKSFGEDKPVLNCKRIKPETAPPPTTEPEPTEPEETEPTEPAPEVLGPNADGTARQLTDGVFVYLEGENKSAFLIDGDHTTKLSFSGTQTLSVKAKNPFSNLYIQWDDAPGNYTLTYLGNKLQCGSEGFIHDYIQLPEAVTEVLITFESTKSKTLCDVELFTQGSLPKGVQDWKQPCDKADILVFPTHSDDDVYFFGPLIAYYAIERELTVQTAFMVEHADVTRRHERLNGLWEMGVRHYPILFDAPDRAIGTLSSGLRYYQDYDIYGWQIEQIRRFKPLVVVGHDLDGEYGNMGHKVNAHYLVQAVPDAADPAKHTASARKYGTWNTPKLYIHLYELNDWKFDVNTPMVNDPQGRSPIQVADVALDCHVTQGGIHSSVGQSEYNVIWSSRPFGLYRTLVGYDTRADVMENIDRSNWR